MTLNFVSFWARKIIFTSKWGRISPEIDWCHCPAQICPFRHKLAHLLDKIDINLYKVKCQVRTLCTPTTPAAVLFGLGPKFPHFLIWKNTFRITRIWLNKCFMYWGGTWQSWLHTPWDSYRPINKEFEKSHLANVKFRANPGLIHLKFKFWLFQACKRSLYIFGPKTKK